MFQFYKKSVLGALCCVLCALVFVGSANAVSYNMTQLTSRPAIANATRMPSISGVLTGTGVATTVALAEHEYIDLYLDCLRGDDACGSGFEECTTKTLFYGRKSACANKLIALPANAVNTLFGTNNTTYLANRSTTEKDENGDFAFIYPTNGSLLGGMIEGAMANNRLNTQECVRRYQQCLRREDVCGNEFELCTTASEFKKQKIFCGSTLARCGDEGKKELFGSIDTTGNPSSTSRMGIMISEGAELAAVNAVGTCYKIADACILQACSYNPYECKEGTDTVKVCAAGSLSAEDRPQKAYCQEGDIQIFNAVNRNEIKGVVQNECLDTIGANKYCFSTVMGKQARDADLKDPDIRKEVFDDLFSSRFNSGMQAKINDLIDRFDRKTRQMCQDTIVPCAMMSCGDGNGAACYAIAFNQSNRRDQMGVTNPKALEQIKYGCEHIVNNDLACKYVAATFVPTTGTWNWERNSIFDVLFTAAEDTTAKKPDATGAVAELNARLSTSYNQAALDGMRLQCQNVAQSCIKSMCGSDYSNCFRNRTDIMSSIGSMPGDFGGGRSNLVRGVLDRAIVIGLCMNTVRDNQLCAEHIRTESARIEAGRNTSGSTVWGGSGSVRDGWISAASVAYDQRAVEKYQMRDEYGRALCMAELGNEFDVEPCGTEGYTIPYEVESTLYSVKAAENQIFQKLVYDMELEAQAIYNAKITKQQNLCLASNRGGVMGNRDMAGAFMWVRLNTQRVPADYAIKGLSPNQFQASNDLYGSFCRIRVTLHSDDQKIRDAILTGRSMRNYATAYFAAGDAFTCGSWIPSDALEEITDTIIKEKYASGARTRNWITAASAVVGAIGGGVGMNYLQEKKGLGGLLGTIKTQDTKEIQDKRACIQALDASIIAIQRDPDNSSKRYDAKSAGSTITSLSCTVYQAEQSPP